MKITGDQWANAMLNGIAENLTHLPSDGDLEPVLLMDALAGFTMMPLNDLIGTPDWPGFLAFTLPALIAERQAGHVALITMGLVRDAEAERDRTEVVVLITGSVGDPPQTHTAKVQRGGGPPAIGEWENNGRGGDAVLEAIRLGLVAQA